MASLTTVADGRLVLPAHYFDNSPRESLNVPAGKDHNIVRTSKMQRSFFSRKS
jgi:hypothetical protein